MSLKTLDTFGNCQRLVFSLGVSQHMHQITNMLKFGCQSCKRIMEEKYTSCVLSKLDFETSAEVSKSIQIFK